MSQEPPLIISARFSRLVRPTASSSGSTTLIEFGQSERIPAVVEIEKELYELEMKSRKLLWRKSELIARLEKHWLEEKRWKLGRELHSLQQCRHGKSGEFQLVRKQKVKSLVARISRKIACINSDIGFEKIRNAEEEEELESEINERMKVWNEASKIGPSVQLGPKRPHDILYTLPQYNCLGSDENCLIS